MKEFGSDFHRYKNEFYSSSFILEKFGESRYYACGRHALEAILKKGGWCRIWMPAYFCYDVISHIRRIGVEVMFYDDHPLSYIDDEIVRKISYKKGDVLLRTDYFGLRRFRSNNGIEVPVIEDHTHGILTEWALNSDADWCIASLRKTAPIATGGILWSPKGYELPKDVQQTADSKEIARVRYMAMDLKDEYLSIMNTSDDEEERSKSIFREMYIDTEDMLEKISISGIDLTSKEIIKHFNFHLWADKKTENWHFAIKMLDSRFKVLGSDIEYKWQPFSIIFLMNSEITRETFRNYLIQHKIYPSILWRIPKYSEFEYAKTISDRMISLHCDARYDLESIGEMCNIINNYYC